MKKLPFFIFCLLVLSPIAFSQSDQWKLVKPENLKCTFVMPKDYEEKSFEGVTLYGNGTEHIYQAHHEKLKYKISVTELPDIGLFSYKSGGLLPYYKQYRNDIRRKYGLKHVEDFSHVYFDYEGFELDYFDDNEYVNEVIFLHDKKLYSLTVTRPVASKKDHALDEDADLFFDAFRLLPVIQKP